MLYNYTIIIIKGLSILKMSAINSLYFNIAKTTLHGDLTHFWSPAVDYQFPLRLYTVLYHHQQSRSSKVTSLIVMYVFNLPQITAF